MQTVVAGAPAAAVATRGSTTSKQRQQQQSTHLDRDALRCGLQPDRVQPGNRGDELGLREALAAGRAGADALGVLAALQVGPVGDVAYAGGRVGAGRERSTRASVGRDLSAVPLQGGWCPACVRWRVRRGARRPRRQLAGCRWQWAVSVQRTGMQAALPPAPPPTHPPLHGPPHPTHPLIPHTWQAVALVLHARLLSFGRRDRGLQAPAGIQQAAGVREEAVEAEGREGGRRVCVCEQQRLGQAGGEPASLHC